MTKRTPRAPRAKSSPATPVVAPVPPIPRRLVLPREATRYLGAWNSFVGDFSAHVRAELLRRAAEPVSSPMERERGVNPELSLQGDPSLWIDRDGMRWDLTRDRLPLEVPWVMPREVGFWILHEPDGHPRVGYHRVDRDRMRAYEAAGMRFAPGALLSPWDAEILAEGDYGAEATEQVLPHVWPAFRVHRGVFSKMFLEGGWEARSIPIPLDPPRAAVTVIDADRVRLALGIDLRGLRLKDGHLGFTDVTVTGSLAEAFTITLKAMGIVPSMAFEDRLKTLTLRWSPADGDPYEYLCAYLREHAFGPGSEEWWY
jgi:hypothetical protein